MSRYVICDVCDNNYEIDTTMGAVQLPGEWIPNADHDTQILLDVCSTECLASMAIRLNQGRMPGDNSDEPVPMDGEIPDQGHDRNAASGSFTKVEDRPPAFISPVRVKTRSEHE